MKIVPIRPVAAQTLKIVLGNQACRIDIYQKFYGLFMDLYVDDVIVKAGTIAQNLNKIVRDEYYGFVGDFVFIDNQGTDDPDYTGLGDRFSLAYLEASDLTGA